ncbi:zinc finger protein 879-like isoform X1 [Leptidea sinapis]|uniref:zinc finger protein 879-like isoform X1 n=2 Tax=Leptidea sinapis TaxID=189913 RepID=UPI00212680F9|nr:zinc finger protein 879-like isoform X1 [Leptidea sinapis]
MANVKARVNTSKTSNTNKKGKVGRPRKLTSVKNVKDKNMVLKKFNTRSSGKISKAKVLLDPRVVRDKNDKEADGNQSKLKKLLLRSGHIRYKNKFDFNVLDEILKSELLIKEHTEKLSAKIAKNTIPKKKNKTNTSKCQESRKETKSNGLLEEPRTISPSGLIHKRLGQEGQSEVYPNTNNFPKNISDEKISEILGCKSIGKIFICNYCHKGFNSKETIKRHIMIHMNVPNIPCPQCNRIFSNTFYLAAHTRRQHPNWEKHYMCNICDMPFLLKSNLKVHLTSHSQKEKMFKCIYCKEKYQDQHALVQHEKKHLVDDKYLCIICDMAFDCRNRLTSHYRIHRNVKDFICQECGKGFLRLNSLRRHVQVSHSGHRLQCPVCNKSLKGHLAEHMRTHNNKRPHECPDCGQRFTQSTQLTVHRRAHTGARPYTCRICDKPFSHSNALMLHIRIHTGEKPFSCAMCPMSFSQLPHMKAHMRNIHGKVNPYRCPKCDQFFKLKADLDSHSKSCKKSKTNAKASQDDKLEEAEITNRLTRMRFLLALLLTMIATKDKLKYLGFNKRLIDELLMESLEAMGHKPCKDSTLTPFDRLQINIQMLLEGTVPTDQMDMFKKESKTIEQILELLTDEKRRP